MTSEFTYVHLDIQKLYRITLPLTNNVFLQLVFSAPQNTLNRCHELTISLCFDNKKIPLYRFFAGAALAHLERLLSRMLDNQQKPISAPDNLGIEWNKYLQNAVESLQKKSAHSATLCKSSSWKYASQVALEMPQGPTSWLYHKKDAIILEVTPTYPWFFLTPASKEIPISFEDFMQEYKPLFTAPISKKILTIWHSEITKLLSLCKQNEKMARKAEN